MFRSALSPHAADGLAELRNEHHAALTDADVVRLNELGWGVDGEDDTASVPYHAGNILLHQPTAMALQWFADNSGAFGDSRDLRLFAYAFALAHGRGLPLAPRVLSWQERLCRRLTGMRDDVTLDQVQGGCSSRRAVRAWMLSCTATLAEIDAAIGEMEADATLPAEGRARDALRELYGYFRGDKTSAALRTLLDALPPRPEKPETSWEDACHEIAACTGTDPAMWTRAPCAALRRSYRAAMRHAALAAGTGCNALGGAAEAVTRFRAAVVEIVKREREKHAPQT